MKAKFYLPFLFAMLAGCIVFTSCGDKDESKNENQTGGNSVSNPDIKPGQTLSPAEQKEYLEAVALQFMNMIPASDFNDISDLGHYISDTYIDGYDWDNVEEWAEDIMDNLRESLGTQDVEYRRGGKYVYSNYKAVVEAANFKGHFTARNGEWIQSKADDLQFIFKDKAGKQCILKLETSGSVKKVHILDVKDWKDYKYSEGFYTDYYDRTNYVVGVPENIVVTLSQNGSNVIKTTVNIDLSSIYGEEFDFSRSNMNASASIELNNGYKFTTSQIAYQANNMLTASFSMTKNGESLITMNVSSEPEGIPSYYLSEVVTDGIDDNNHDLDNANAKKSFFKVDVLGKVQVEGKLADVRRYIENIQDAEDNDTNESKFKSYVNQANSLASVFLFYNGTSTKQASMTLESFSRDSWGGKTYWKMEPVINFFDGSSYSTVEVFFNEKDFKKTCDMFEKLLDNYSNLLD